MASLGYAQPTLLAEITELAEEDGDVGHYLVLERSDAPGLAVSSRGIVCSLTPEQAESLTRAIRPTTRHYQFGDEAFTVLYVRDSADNHGLVEKLLGDRLTDRRHTRPFRRDALVPFLTPVFVS